MFKKLRNRLILINLGVTTLVIVVVFSAIYLSSTHFAETRAPRPMDNSFVSPEPPEGSAAEPPEETAPEPPAEDDPVGMAIREEQAAAAKQLLLTLIISGVAIELAVAFISYFLAEESIKPVREAYTAQKVFIANASHEIKTPLAAISANLEAADIKDNRWIDNAVLETEKLAKLNASLLTLARTDLTAASPTSSVDLKTVINETVESFAARLKPLDFKKQIKTSGKVKLAAEDFSQILAILLDNAIKYCDHEVMLVADNRHVTVINDGKNIHKSDLPRLFDLFYQVDKTAEGVGLGLSIAKSLADRHHWRLTADSDLVETRFTLHF